MLHLQDTDLGVDRVARRCGMSRHVLQRKLKAAGTTLSAEIIEVKKQRACELLVDTTKSVVEVAAALGFLNPTSFCQGLQVLDRGITPRVSQALAPDR